MGVVYEAVQESLGRHVALKVFAPWARTDGKMIERFQREAKAAARLHHTNIVPVFGVGEHDSYRYYVMQYIQGQGLDAILGELRRLRSAQASSPESLTGQEATEAAPLSTTIARSLLTAHFSDPAREPRADGSEIGYELFDPTPPPAPTSGEVSSDTSSHWASQPGGSYARTIARVGLQVAEALQHAHGQGILHRDIKPSNLLLDIAGNVWVTDFGLAKADDAGDLTDSGDVVGTARYMAPERFRGESDPQSDVYSLGATLYELLTLRPAYEERDRACLIDRILHADPPPLRAVDPRIRRDLETIVLKAMSKEPARRYATAGEMADDLRRFLADRPIRARRTPWHERGFRWCRRNPMLATLLGCVATLVLFIAGSIGWMARDRAALDAALDKQVEMILAEAGSLIDEANWLKAMSAVERAEKLLDAAKRRGLPQHLRDLKSDLAMVVRLQNIYPEAKVGEQRSQEDHFWGRAQDAEFAKAFQQFGIDIDARQPVESARSIAGRSIRQALVKALDEWAAARRRTDGKDDPGWRKLVEVARQADPDSWRNHCRDALLNGDRHALEQLADLVPIRQVPPPTLWLLGVTLQELGARENAMALLRRAQHEYPDDEWLNDTLGWFSTSKFDPPRHDDALRFYAAALALHPNLARHHAAVAGALVKKGAAEDALVEFAKAIELEPKNPDLWMLRGIAHADSGQHAKAVLDFTKATELDPDNPDLWIRRGIAHADSDQHAKAVLDYNKAIELGSKNPGLWIRRGISHAGSGQHAKAVLDFTKAIELYPKNPDLWIRRGLSHAGSGEHAKAVLDATKAIELDPNISGAWNSRGMALKRLGQHTKAVLDFGKAIELGPKNPVYWGNRGDSYKELGQWDRAISDCTKAIELDPRPTWYLFRRGFAYNYVRKWNQAAVDFNRAIELDPIHGRFYNARGWAYANLGQHEQAYADLDKGIKLDPKDLGGWSNRGRLHAHGGRWNEALADLSKTIELGSDDPRIWYYVALVHLQLGDHSRYRKQCAAMLGHFGASLGAGPAYSTVSACVLRPDSVDDWGPVLRLADQALEKDPKNLRHRFTGALARYRAGRFEDAARKLEGIEADSNYNNGPNLHLFVAMTRARLGQADFAKERLAKACRQIDELPPVTAKDLYVRPWDYRLSARVVRREAEALIGTKAADLPVQDKGTNPRPDR